MTPVELVPSGGGGDTDAAHQRLLHFVGVSEWSDAEVRAEVAVERHQVAEREPLAALCSGNTPALQGRLPTAKSG